MVKWFRDNWLIAVLVVAVVLGLYFLFAPKADATYIPEVQVDECNETFDYTKTSDFMPGDNRLSVDFQDGDESITVTAKAGYELVWVKLDVENDNQQGHNAYPVVSGVKFNPNPGGDIDSAQIRVKKVCVTPTPTPTQVATPSATPVDPDKCPNNDLKFAGIQTEVPAGATIDYKGNCVDITPTVEASAAVPAVEELPATGGNSLVVGMLTILGLIGAAGVSVWSNRKLSK